MSWRPESQCRWMTHRSHPRGFSYACQLPPGHDGEHEAHFGKVTSTYWEPPDDGVEDPDYVAAEVRGAFRALAEIGLAVTCGELLLAADSMALSLGPPSHHASERARCLRRLNFAKDALLGRDRTSR